MTKDHKSGQKVETGQIRPTTERDNPDKLVRTNNLNMSTRSDNSKLDQWPEWADQTYDPDG